MSALRIAAISILALILVVLASVLGWRALRTGVVPPKSQPSGQQMNAPPQQQSSPAPPTIAPAVPAANRLGPFSIAGQDYFIELQTRKVRPSAADQQGDTVAAMEIRDAAGVVQYRRTFPYVEAKEDYFESWSVSALRLTGTNGTGLLVRYDVYSEPSAPEEEATG